jgi:hypothetical protein
MYVIKKLGKQLEELQKKEKITEKEIIEVLETDELFTYVKKSKS